MTEIPEVFHSDQALRGAFVAGLERMLAGHSGLGIFILVLANATCDSDIHERLQSRLRERFGELADALREDLRAGRPLTDAVDDVLVFLKLMAVGLDRLELARARPEGAFELQYNPLRAYRPPRMSDVAVTRLYSPYDPNAFNFNKPFLHKEIFWSGEIGEHQCRLLYNKFPFAELHGLLVIDPQDNKPQWLTHADHAAVWRIAALLGAQLPGVGFAYNAYGAFASVNHQHLQMFVRSVGRYPIEAGHWQHNGGERRYPLACRVYRDRDAAWEQLHRLHESNIPYNLLYRPGCVYLVARRFQGSYQHAGWTGGFAWSEVCGAVTTFNSRDFGNLDEKAIFAEMEKLRT
jgi:hypothetical protein